MNALFCGSQIGWLILCGVGFALTLVVVQRRMIYRILPLNHFGDDPSGYSKVKFWHDEPAEMRRVWKYKALVAWPSIWGAGLVILYVVSYMISHVSVAVK